jgi:endonuclease YncB( thermonuclease family)
LKRRTVRLLTRLLIALLLVGLGYLSEQNTELKKDLVSLSPGTYAVTQFHDGDTINVNMDGQEEEIRFIGVDTPETQDPRKAVQCFGKAASEFTKLLIGSQPVRLEADPLSSNRDRYDRLLRYVYLPDGRLVQAEIIKQGYGFALTGFPHTKMDEFIGYQREAREQNRGLWSSCEPTESTPGRFTSNDAL